MNATIALERLAQRASLLIAALLAALAGAVLVGGRRRAGVAAGDTALHRASW